MKTLKTVNPFNTNKTYKISFANGKFIIKQYVKGYFVSTVQESLHNTSEICFISVNALRRLAKPSLFQRVLNWFNKPSKRALKMEELQKELSRKLETTNFKYIGGLSVLEQLQIIRLRDSGKSQAFIATKLDTSRGSVIRILKQKAKIIYIANVFHKIDLL